MAKYDPEWSHDLGYCAVAMTGESGTEFRIPLEKFGYLVGLWEQGAKHLHFTTVHGGEVVVRAEYIESISAMDSDALARFKELRAEEKAQRMREGDD